MHHPTDRITHTTAVVTPVVGHWLERESTVIEYWKHCLSDKTKHMAANESCGQSSDYMYFVPLTYHPDFTHDSRFINCV